MGFPIFSVRSRVRAFRGGGPSKLESEPGTEKIYMNQQWEIEGDGCGKHKSQLNRGTSFADAFNIHLFALITPLPYGPYPKRPYLASIFPPNVTPLSHLSDLPRFSTPKPPSNMIRPSTNPSPLSRAKIRVTPCLAWLARRLSHQIG